MTAEICIMNRLAAVLAADSATTVTQWPGGREERRYFKGANKIFQVSDFQPIGMMVFDSASLLNVPWEVVAKEFRKHLEKKTYDHVAEYAQAFFEFLDSDQLLFPLQVRRDNFLAAACSASIQCARLAENSVPAGDPNPGATINTHLARRRQHLDSVQFPSCTDPTKLATEIASSRDDVQKAVEEFFADQNQTFAGDLATVSELGLVEVFHAPEDYLGTTGIVFAGFGDKDVFPAAVEYQSCSFIGHDHAHHLLEEMQIDHEVPAVINAFAQTSMTETFRMGIDREFYIATMGMVEMEMQALADQVIQDSGGTAANIQDLSAIIDSARRRVGDKVLGKATRENAYPLQRVVGSLPIDDMANLAETLINLQSLKERVTKPSETVGGPVDVAVITRAEGLVWIKRKHYFPSELNSRFQERQSALYK